MAARNRGDRRLVLAVLILLLNVAAFADEPTPRIDSAQLAFESFSPDGAALGWMAMPPSSTAADNTSKHGGKTSLRLESKAAGQAVFSTVMRSIPIDFTGKTLTMRGWLRKDGDGVPSLWMRQDGHDSVVAFVDMSLAPTVTSDWAQYSISFDLQDSATALYFGVRLVGIGKAWTDDIELLVDGQPLNGTPRVVRPPDVLDEDKQFVGGSGLALERLDERQLENLVLAGKVWGFLKYHHPAVTLGTRHWDFDLLRELPAFLAAKSDAELHEELLKWIDSLGALSLCDPCASLETERLQLTPQVEWINNRKFLGKRLSQRLQTIYRARVPNGQFYVKLAPDVGNPVFQNELQYPQLRFPDTGFQVLSIYRYWNVIEYWFPYRDLVDEDWDRSLETALRKGAAGLAPDDFQRVVHWLISQASDGHANFLGPRQVREPAGECQLPVNLRFVEGRFVVKSLAANDENAHRFEVGDVLKSIGGKPVNEIVAAARNYYGASNDAWRYFKIAGNLTRGTCGAVDVTLLRESEQRVRSERVPVSTLLTDDSARNDRAGDTFQMLSPEVAYLKLSSIKIADIAGYIQRAATAKSLIIDIRNYPSEFVVFALGSLLVEKETPFATFTQADLSNPGAFYWGATVSLSPAAPHFSGDIGILVDESTISQAEYTAMALRVAPRSRIFGTQTAGADGNVSYIPLPGSMGAGMTGIGVFYPDKRATQRRGVDIDVKCPQTIAGLRARRDETLECALKALGKH